tara:strand:- start:1530 stop:2384 length:855 start_codon:yes stop_codon:yes gene_type:complete
MHLNLNSKKEKPVVLSLGAGVQSTALALMAAKKVIKPMPELAIFADTQAEPQYTYDHLEKLIKLLPYPVEVVTAGSLTEKSLQERKRQKDGLYYMPKEIPLFGIKKDGSITGGLGRQCTNDFKIQPITKFLRNKFNIKRGEKNAVLTQWLGISWEEVQRMKPSRIKFIENAWPLIDLRMRRSHCLQWLKDNDFDVPPRSACYYCPFHSDKEWREIRNNAPQDFEKAVEFDKQIRAKFLKYDKMNMEVFLHRSCKPLDEIDFDTDEDKGQQIFDFKNECEGLCGT